jgi:hypothetical protein
MVLVILGEKALPFLFLSFLHKNKIKMRRNKTRVSGSMSGFRNVVLLISAFGAAAMASVIIWAFVVGDFVVEGKWIIDHPWGGSLLLSRVNSLCTNF